MNVNNTDHFNKHARVNTYEVNFVTGLYVFELLNLNLLKVL